MFRVDFDAHVDETDATWDYLGENERRFKPATLDPGAATGRAIRGRTGSGYRRHLLLRRWRDDKRTGTVKAPGSFWMWKRDCATWTSCALTCRCLSDHVSACLYR